MKAILVKKLDMDPSNEILNAYKYKNIKEFSFFRLIYAYMLFLLLINVEMTTTVGILTFMSRKNSC